jgi:RHS repeat-associated protein
MREVQGEHWVESCYDTLGNLIRTVTSLGHTVDYEVDANGFVSILTTLNNHTLAFKRNAYGQETGRQMPSGVVIEQRYDDLGRLLEQRVGPGRLGSGNASVIPLHSERIRRRYTYDRNGSLTSIVDNNRGRVDYIYDPAERLLRAIREQGPSESFSYDLAGNSTRIQTQDRELTDETLVYGPGHRLLQKGSTCYGYDAEGRRVQKIESADSAHPIVWQYEWDALDRLRAVMRPNGEVWRYKYDALGRRVEKVGPNKQQQFLWDKDVIIHEFNGMCSLSTWIFDAYSFTPLATVQNNQVYSIINDHLGTPKELVDHFGEIAWSVSGSAWGEAESSPRRDHSADCPIRFQGHWADDETSFCYNFYRYYDPRTGRYVSQDPSGLLGGDNLYYYTPNPIVWVDPLGCAYQVTGNTAGQDTLARGVHVNVRGPGLPPRGGHVGFVPNASGTGLVPVPVDAATRGLTANQSRRLMNDVVAHMDRPENVSRMRAQAQAGIDAFPGTPRARELQRVRDILAQHEEEGTNPCRST